ncbi:MAG: hypothetical protein B7Z60_05025 [Ferrovum sp. 37-45-19]|uniref:DUF484 family protein n=1 Tax=Ferrovum sp. JA12 TaxID=1356299 RepID=UPI000703266B|nr:DUF484 family protein [Ferrovum sp. JA12]OYV79707.1 MAG: hypothetical protein B7Z65_04980 [Ferrovum sp. 21-44-67]OYV94311.1 MAG: hypothetical protein B7Z60_05025 [Ferrovum sp. 37-45-19]OZB32387.1 MAG: hypothetical protein B7X47_06705 [Ferrovum sp. 34-44-207]HQT80565.1 DUF484 family protein [Ferrovaceae bacterium]KRH79654.1 hypothetical protein FERRO_07260 [Ferrovum sp. JA12]
MSFSSAQVANWLTLHPDFFNEHSHLLTELSIPHPHGTHAVSLNERQLIALRDNNRSLDKKLSELIGYAKENDDISAKIHRFSCELISQRLLSGVLATTYHSLSEHFHVPHLTMRLWAVSSDERETQEAIEFSTTSRETQHSVEQLNAPLCGDQLPHHISQWLLGEEKHCGSFALLPLKQERTFGALLLGAEDKQRFYQGMGTLYLERLAELIAYSIKRHSHGQDIID